MDDQPVLQGRIADYFQCVDVVALAFRQILLLNLLDDLLDLALTLVVGIMSKQAIHGQIEQDRNRTEREQQQNGKVDGQLCFERMYHPVLLLINPGTDSLHHVRSQ